jgi:type IV fimbrial biogenesis protein FimT
MRSVPQIGVTLLELCVGLALVALLATLAVPGFQGSLRAAAVRAAAYDLLTGLQQARGAAIVESRPAVLCLADATENCLAAGSAPAWRSYLEAGSGALPVAHRLLPAGITLHGSRSRIRFSPHALAASTATLTICDERGLATPRAIVVSQNSRARIAVADPAECRP